MGKLSLIFQGTLFFSGIGMSNFYFSKRLLEYNQAKNDELMKEIEDLKGLLTSTQMNSQYQRPFEARTAVVGYGSNH